MIRTGQYWIKQLGTVALTFFFQDNRFCSLPRQGTLSTDPPRAGHTIVLPCVFIVAETEQEGKTRPTRPGLEGEPYESESNSVYVLGLGLGPSRSCALARDEREIRCLFFR